MNKIALSLCCLLLCAPSAFASIPEGYPPALDGQGLGKAPTFLPEIDYISPKVVPLTNQEKQALHLSGSWSRQSGVCAWGQFAHHCGFTHAGL